MSSAPFDIALVIERLKAEVPALLQVRGAADYAAVTSLKDFRPPEAYVLLARERGKALAGHRRQPAAVYFGVVVAVRNYRYERGAPAVQDANPLIGEIRDALIGWTPSVPGGRPCTWLQGDVLDYDQGTLLWSEVFETQQFIGRSA